VRGRLRNDKTRRVAGLSGRTVGPFRVPFQGDFSASLNWPSAEPTIALSSL